MKAMVVYQFEKDGKVITANGTTTFCNQIPSVSELMLLKKNLRENLGYKNVVILNWFEVEEV